MKPHIEKLMFRLAAVACTILFLLLMSGCSALSGLAAQAVTGAITKSEPLVGVDTEIIAGDKQQGVDSGTDTKLDDVVVQDNAQIHTNTVGKATDINRADNVILNEGVPFWQAALAVLVAIMLGLLSPQFTVNRKR